MTLTHFIGFQESSQEYIDACELMELFSRTKNMLIGEVSNERTEKENLDKSTEPGRSIDTSEKMEPEEVSGMVHLV